MPVKRKQCDGGCHNISEIEDIVLKIEVMKTISFNALIGYF